MMNEEVGRKVTDHPGWDLIPVYQYAHFGGWFRRNL